ncbi:methyltransferase domain-containing protein [uncultured Thiocystis sp.]|uniref:methyltransferase domain-containing protein n=1 Tax=uncultured Thiocystis sp. TaxID=1202134 RepID=UPI0025F71AFF|nr:methyltransferase domain-containing protein [uncultured Thiocystis sp.]
MPTDQLFQVVFSDRQTMEVVPLSRSDQSLLGRSKDQRWFVKVELQAHPFKRNSLLEEAGIIRELNQRGCVSCPELYAVGQVQASALADLCQLPADAQDMLPALILPYLSTQSAVGLPDLLFSIQEQRKLGWFHADLKPDNLRFSPETQVCSLIDYDQAEPLTQQQMNLPLVDFLRWADRRVREKYARFKFNGLFHYFPGVTMERDILPRLDQGRLDVGQTMLFRSAETTLNPSKVYHTIDLPDVLAHGERTLDDRLRLMNLVRFLPGERVLDVGCNSGLLCAYLTSRGCVVKGIDLDPYVIRGARMLSNLRGDAIDFACVDLDQADDLGRYDTVMLFSVLHHTQQVPRNAQLIADASKRIIIECRLHEQGAKPVDGRWIATTAWSFENLNDLIDGLLALFPGFTLFRNHGQADRDRYVLEFIREGVDWSGATTAEDKRPETIQGTEPSPQTSNIEDPSTKQAENEALDYFLVQNTRRWAKIQPRRTDQCILVELLVGHPGYFIANAVLAKYLQLIHGCAIKAILPDRKNAYLHALAASYGITDYYYEEDLGRFITHSQQESMYRTLQHSGSDLRKALLEININGIRVGDLIYDMYLRNTGNVTVETLDDRLLETAISAIGYYQLYDGIFCENNVIATAVGHTVYTRFGILARVSVAHGAPVYAKKPAPLLVRQYRKIEEFPEHETTFDASEFAYVWNTRREQALAKGRTHMADQLNSEASSAGKNGMGRWYSEAYGKDRQIYTRERFCEVTGIDDAKPIVILFSHCMPDAPHCFPSSLFDDYYQWLVQTLAYVANRPQVNWIVKPHPDDKYYHSKISAEQVYASFAHHPHIALAPSDLNNRSLFEFAQAIVTVTGTAGLEFASQGVPVILAGKGLYSGHGFTHEPETLDAYYCLLDHVESLPRLNTDAIERVYVLIATQIFYARARCLYMPDMPLTPWEPYDLADVFHQVTERTRDHDFGEDPFFRSLLLQVVMDAKHLFNYEQN